jgi:hypothetical protein
MKDGGVQTKEAIQAAAFLFTPGGRRVVSGPEEPHIRPHSTLAIGYDGQYTYAARIDPDRASSEAQQYSEGSGAPARSVSQVREPERADYRALGILSDSVFPV